MNRRTEVLSWLKTSSLAIPWRRATGFFVLRGARVQLADGTLMDALDWLDAEGFQDVLKVEGYSVVYSPPGGEYAEKLTFFEQQTAFDVPFSKPKPKPNHTAALLAALRGDMDVNRGRRIN